MRIIFLGLLFLSFNSFGQSLSPYFTRTRTLQLEGYSSTGVNIPYSYSGGSVNSWTINDTLAHSWVNERVQAALTGFTSIDSARVYDSLADHRTDIDLKLNIADADYWPLEGDFNTVGNQTITFGGSHINILNQGTGSSTYQLSNSLITGGPTAYSRIGLVRGTTPGATSGYLALFSTINGSSENTGIYFDLSGENPTSTMNGIYFKDQRTIRKGFEYDGVSVDDFTDSTLVHVKYVKQAIDTCGGVNEFYVATSIDSVRNEVEADSVLYWKRSGISNLGSGDIQIRKTTTGNVSILNEDNLGFLIDNTSGETKLGDDSNYLQFYNGTINGFLLDSDSIQFNALSNQSMLITDKRSAGNRHGLRYAGDYSARIRETPNALTTMKTVWDYVDSLGLGSPDAADVSYTPATTGDWPNADPTTVQGGLDSLAERITDVENILDFTVKDTTIAIGVWDLATNPTVTVTTGVAQGNLRSGISIIVFSDSGIAYTAMSDVAGGPVVLYPDPITTTSVTINRVSGSFLDGTNFDDGVINRGYISFKFAP